MNYEDEIDNEKKNLLYQLHLLSNQGIKLSRYYDMNSDLNEMRYEYELQKKG